MAELAHHGPGCVTALLVIRSRHPAAGPSAARLRALGGFVRRFPNAAERRLLSDRIGDLLTITPAQRAWLDLGLLSMGAAPTALPPSAGQPDSEPYIADLTSHWKRLKRQSSQFSADRCIQAWASYPGASGMGERQGSGGCGRQSRRTAARVRPPAPAGRRGRQQAGLGPSRETVGLRQGLAGPGAERPGSGPERVAGGPRDGSAGCQRGAAAGLYLRAQLEGVSPDEACRRLAKSDAVSSAQLAVNTVLALQRDLTRSGAPEQGH